MTLPFHIFCCDVFSGNINAAFGTKVSVLLKIPGA